MTFLFNTRLLAALLATSILAGASLAQAESPLDSILRPWESKKLDEQPTPSVKVEILSGGQLLACQSAQSDDGQIAAPTPVPVDLRKVEFPRLGEEHAIRITNTGTHRIMAKVSVASLNAIDGKPDLNLGGYVLAAGESCTITGWRMDEQRVRPFLVSKPADSETAPIGRIFVTAFAEQNETPQIWILLPSVINSRYDTLADAAMECEPTSAAHNATFHCGDKRVSLEFRCSMADSAK